MSDPASRDWRLYLDDMLRFAGKVLAYSQGLDQAAAFVASARRRRKSSRNRLIHGYLGIDDDTVWSIIETDIPALLGELQRLKADQDGTTP